MYTFEETTNFIQKHTQIWVRLYDDMKLCLVGVDDSEKQVFSAKFLPCARNAQVYKIAYSKIKAVEDPHVEVPK